MRWYKKELTSSDIIELFHCNSTCSLQKTCFCHENCEHNNDSFIPVINITNGWNAVTFSCFTAYRNRMRSINDNEDNNKDIL